jgi:hypothetical protein
MKEPYFVRERFIVPVGRLWADPWPQYFENFWAHCGSIANENDWNQLTVANYELKPLGGKLIQTSTQGWYLRWDDEKTHAFFILKWS